MIIEQNYQVLLNYTHYSFVIQIKSRYDEITPFYSEIQKVFSGFFAGKAMTRQHKLEKHLLFKKKNIEL